MGEGKIIRKVVVGEPIPGPTIILLSKTTSSVTFTLTNNSISEQDITFGLTTPPTTTTISLAPGETSSNQTFTDLNDNTTITIFAQALNGLISQLSVTTNPRVFIVATGGTEIEYDLNNKRYRSHTFTSNGTLIVLSVGDDEDDRNKVDYLIIGGGGSGGNTSLGGGGGGGAYLTTLTPVPSDEPPRDKIILTETQYQFTIGAGAGPTQALQGGSSTGLGQTAVGGGGGARTIAPTNGGSGGGAGAGTAFDGGLGILGQGRNGGTAIGTAGGGGGGAGGVGTNATGPGPSTGGSGGNGLASIIRNGTSETRAGGGFGSGDSFNGSTGLGGGSAANQGGGANSITSATGGSGIAIVRYEIAPA